MLTVLPIGFTYAQDPDLPDSLIIADISGDIGDTIATVPVYAVTDDPVSFFNLPLNLISPGGGFSIETANVISDQLLQWDEIYSDFVYDGRFLRLFGIWDTGQEDNPVLDTDYQRVHILDLVISIEPGAPDQYVTIDNTVDPIGGPILLGLDNGITEFTPAFKGGLITFGNPTSIDDNEISKPLAFGLKQNYPNPFNPQTTIEFSLEKGSTVRLEVFNLLGQKVDELAEGYFQSGVHSFIWSARDTRGEELPSGVYFYTLTTDSDFSSGKMLLLR
ncbi:MAG: T9SS type A sorting domain-containing protein [candidate division Zixibacteria bacterium]